MFSVLRSDRLLAAFVVVVALLALVPVTWPVFFTFDDYDMAHALFLGEQPIEHKVLYEGRVLFGSALRLTRWFGDDVVAFANARRFSVIGYAFLAVAYAGVLRARGRSRSSSAFAAAAIVASVQTLDLAIVGGAWLGPLITLAALFAHRLVDDGARDARTSRLLAGGALLTLLLATGQSIALLTFPLLLLSLYDPARPLVGGDLWRWLARHAVVWCAACAVYVVVFFWLPLHLTGVQAAGRAGVSVNPLGKLAWFVTVALRDTLSLFSMSDLCPQDIFTPYLRGGQAPVVDMLRAALDDPNLPMVLAVFAFAWTGAALAAPAGRRVVTLVLTALLWLASYGILLVVNDWWASFRTEGPLLCALCFTCAIALDAFAARLPGLVRIVPVVVVAAVATLLLNVWVVGRDFVVRPLGCEWRTLTADVAAHASATSIVAVPRRASDDLVAPGLHHDLGWPASSRNYGANAMVDVARLHLGLPRIPVTTLAPGADAPDEAAAAVVLGCRREHLR